MSAEKMDRRMAMETSILLTRWQEGEVASVSGPNTTKASHKHFFQRWFYSATSPESCVCFHQGLRFHSPRTSWSKIVIFWLIYFLHKPLDNVNMGSSNLPRKLFWSRKHFLVVQFDKSVNSTFIFVYRPSFSRNTRSKVSILSIVFKLKIF